MAVLEKLNTPPGCCEVALLGAGVDWLNGFVKLNEEGVAGMAKPKETKYFEIKQKHVYDEHLESLFSVTGGEL